MTPDQGVEFLKALHSHSISKAGKWVRASCPLAQYRHQNQKDSSPSFGLTVEADKHSNYNCYSCGSGSAVELLGMLDYYAGGKHPNTDKAREILDQEDLELPVLPGYQEFASNEYVWKFKAWDEFFLKKFKPAIEVPVARDYLIGRNIKEQQIVDMGLLFDVVRQMIVFVTRDAYGQLAGCRGRSVNKLATGMDRHHDYAKEVGHSNVKGVWYNEQSLHLPGWVVVVEGQFDVLTVQQRWPKVVGNLTAKPTEEKAAKLSLTEGVILIPDNDLTGSRSTEQYQQQLARYKTPLKVLNLPKEVKDCNDAHPDFIGDLLQNFSLL